MHRRLSGNEQSGPTGEVGLALGSHRLYVRQEEYFPYGKSSDRRDERNRYRYIGVERDFDTSLSMTGPRTYDPVLGRFLQPDGIPKAHASPFSYSQSKPIGSRDPSGYETSEEAAARVAKEKRLAATTDFHGQPRADVNATSALSGTSTFDTEFRGNQATISQRTATEDAITYVNSNTGSERPESVAELPEMLLAAAEDVRRQTAENNPDGVTNGTEYSAWYVVTASGKEEVYFVGAGYSESDSTNTVGGAYDDITLLFPDDAVLVVGIHSHVETTVLPSTADVTSSFLNDNSGGLGADYSRRTSQMLVLSPPGTSDAQSYEAVLLTYAAGIHPSGKVGADFARANVGSSSPYTPASASEADVDQELLDLSAVLPDTLHVSFVADGTAYRIGQ